jgi:MmgE/PrpD N-terminal domain
VSDLTMPGFAGDRLAHFVAASNWDELTQEVRHEGRRSLLNFIGGALGVAHAPSIEMALRVLEPFSAPKRVTVLGRMERLDPLSAAFINAVAGNLLDYDDTHLRTVIHPTAPVAPVALALAEQRGLSGAAMLHAFILGAEVTCRIGNAVSPGHYARGWHITSTCGIFGSAAASAKLLGLGAAQTWNALGIAASQSAGIVENLPSAAKKRERWERRPQRPVRGSAGGTGLHRCASRDRGCPRLGTRNGRRSRCVGNNRRPWHAMGDPKEHLQALSVRDRDARRDRRMPRAAARSRADGGGDR